MLVAAGDSIELENRFLHVCRFMCQATERRAKRRLS